MTKIQLSMIVAITSIALLSLLGVTSQNVFADHAFEGGVSTGTMPNSIHVFLAGQVMRPGDYLPIADFSPNYITGHFLLIVPCDSNGKPAVIPIGGHFDEIEDKTWVDQLQMNYISHASAPGKTCVYHSHVPAVGISSVAYAGPPRVTDIGLVNLSGKTVVFRTGNVAMFTLLTIAGDISGNHGYGPGSEMPPPYNVKRLPSAITGNAPIETGHSH